MTEISTARHVFSSDPSRIDAERVHALLSTHAYWALGRPREVHEAAMAGSRNYGVYDAETGRQLAYARVVTDGATFAWLCDVIVDPDARGAGIGVRLVQGVLADLEPLRLKRIALVTEDAHGLYRKAGFEVLDDPERWMVRPGVL
ncbi:GNAT family N-acetyltransferase [Isoptericola variabilis]|nr:GNAT family N-acetyltransferase [Isoptericola variabilis]